MHRRRARARDGDAAIVRTEQHLLLCREITCRRKRSADIVEDLACALLRVRVAEHGRLLRGVALHAVCERVNARRRDNLRRQLRNHRHVENDVVRDHAAIHNSLLR